MAELYERLHGVLDEIAASSSFDCTDTEILKLLDAHEAAARRLESIGIDRIVETSDRDAQRVAGTRSLSKYLAERLRIGGEAIRRLRHAEALGRFHSVHGEELEPRCPATATALSDGAIDRRHVDVILDVLKRIPAQVDAEMRALADQVLAHYARECTPTELKRLGAQILAHLDEDGQLTDDRDRARRRGLRVSAQDPQLMSQLTATLTPTTRAMLDVVLAVWGAPGMNNPDDPESPTGSASDADPQQLDDAMKRDGRTFEQRQHDAFTALLTCILDNGHLGGSHHGLPPQLIVTISESALRHAAGTATIDGTDRAEGAADSKRPDSSRPDTDGVERGRAASNAAARQPIPTATGTLLPLSDVVELAARAHHHLVVFRDHTNEILYFGRQRRLASRSQRLAAMARDGGCTTPGCTRPPFDCQIHHVTDWAAGGATDIDSLTTACAPDNRAVNSGPHGWRTTVAQSGRQRGRAIWHPPDGHPDPTPRTNRIHDLDEIIEQFRRARRSAPSG
nr:HNH endonuclease signature motif containing protein [Gordonia soli]